MKRTPTIVRPWAEFRSSLPSDAIWEGTEALQVGGKTVAQEIGRILERLGCRVEEPAYAGDHGWDFFAYIGDRRIFCQVTHMESYALLVKDKPYLGWFRKRPNLVYWDLLSKLAEELDRDPRFWDIVWERLVPDEPGAARPVGDHPPLEFDFWNESTPPKT